MSDIWTCKIGETLARLLPSGADAPMRAAVERAYVNLTGREPDFLFSGWGGELTEAERAAHEDRLPAPLSSLDTVLTEVADERARQDAKWGERNHPLIAPDVSADLAQVPGRAGFVSRYVAAFYRVPTASAARLSCQANEPEDDNWAAILLEEFCEFLEAAALGDESSARQELVQLGAVAAAAIEAMDRRKA